MAHTHVHDCEHEEVAYCDTCNVVYCKKCGKEWVEREVVISTPYQITTTPTPFWPWSQQPTTGTPTYTWEVYPGKVIW